MIRRIALAALIGVLAVGMSGCILRRAESTEERSEKRDVTDFDAVDFEGFGNVNITQGDEYSLKVSGPGDLVDRLITEVRGDTLHVYMEPTYELWFFGVPNRNIDIELTLPALKTLEVDGAGRMHVEGVETETLKLDLAGAVEVSIDDIDVDELVLDMVGAAKAVATGRAATQNISISGAGDFDGGDLEGRDVEVTASAAGNSTVWATRTLDVAASGAGTVKYYGDPDVSSELDGAGSVHELGDK